MIGVLITRTLSLGIAAVIGTRIVTDSHRK